MAVGCDDDATWCHIVWHLIAPGHITWHLMAPGHIAWHLVMHLAGGNCVMMASGQWPYTWQMVTSGNGIYSVTPDLYMSGNWLRPIGCIVYFSIKLLLIWNAISDFYVCPILYLLMAYDS